MKNPNEVLRQKEEDLARVRHEIESLRIAAALLSDEMADEMSKKKGSRADEILDLSNSSEGTGTDGLFAGTTDSRRSFWRVLKRGK